MFFSALGKICTRNLITGLLIVICFASSAMAGNVCGWVTTYTAPNLPIFSQYANGYNSCNGWSGVWPYVGSYVIGTTSTSWFLLTDLSRCVPGYDCGTLGPGPASYGLQLATGAPYNGYTDCWNIYGSPFGVFPAITQIQVCSCSCDMKASLSGTSQIAQGGVAEFTGSISKTSNPCQPDDITWTISASGQSNVTGSGTQPSASINTEDLEPGNYNINLTATSKDGCNASANLTLTVAQPPNTCSIPKRKFNSTVNMATGSFTHSQSLFSLKGGNLSTDISIIYNSLAPQTGTVDENLIHEFQKALQIQDDGSILYSDWEGTKTYVFTGSGYQPPSGDTSTLVKNNDGTFVLTDSDGSQIRN